MISEPLKRSRDFEARHMPLIPETQRPVFHVTGGVGWINDPNGFSCYKGEYHLFFQYHPYSVEWGPMHWGHVKTRDFLRWERLPAALAPDTAYDGGGCFSGSAIELPDGRHLLFYTGVRPQGREYGASDAYQTQCLAVGDGVDYEKFEGNPVLTGKDLPEGGSPLDFRDPKIWREADGLYRCVVGNRAADGSGAVLLYESGDAFRWRCAGVIDACRNAYGRMWECPDFFPLNGKQVLLVSAQEMAAQGLEFRAGYGTLAFIGTWDEAARRFTREQCQAIDYGIDFYAPQTLKSYDGRRIMIAWMQDWANVGCPAPDSRFFGEMTLPRELSVKEGRLLQNPVRELDAFRGRHVAYQDVPVTTEVDLPGIRGRVLDMTVSVRPAGNGCRWFKLHLAKDGEHATTIRYEPGRSTVRVDRSRCGVRHGSVHVRDFSVRPQNGAIKLRVVLDRHSLEIFVNDGEQAASFILYTPQQADAVSFESAGGVLVDVEKYDLNFE